MEPVVFVVLDAMRWDYLTKEDTPLLYDMAKNGIYCEKLVSSVGFTQRSAIFTGAYPETTGNMTMFILDRQNSPYRFLVPYGGVLHLVQGFCDFWMRVGDRIPNAFGRFICKSGRFVLGRIRWQIFNQIKNGSTFMPPATIPLHLLSSIGVSEDKVPIYDEGAFEGESLFDVMRKTQRSFKYLMFPIVNGDDEDALSESIKAIEEKTDLYLVQFSDSDGLVHLCGPESDRRREIIREVERKTMQLKDAFERKGHRPTWIIIGDHGMTRVAERIDVYRIISKAARKRRLKLGKDFVLFLDSTAARLWSLNSSGADFVKYIFFEEPFASKGFVMDREMARENKIPYGDRKYGDVIWWAHTGVLIYPDYFHDPGKHNLGMHGYVANNDDMKGFALVSGDGIAQQFIPEAHLVDVCPTICDVLKIPYPASSVGVSLFQYDK